MLTRGAYSERILLVYEVHKLEITYENNYSSKVKLLFGILSIV